MLQGRIGALATASLARYLRLITPQNVKLPATDSTELADMVRSCQRLCDELALTVDALGALPVVRVPTELLYNASMGLFPAERMAIFGGRRTGHAITLGPMFDVTSDGPETSCAHVCANPNRLRVALLGIERAGAHLAGWVHSHPGLGPRATEPSTVDRAQHKDWVRDYTITLISIIVVADGVVRFWGTAVENRTVQIEIIGTGLTPVPGYRHVYQLAR